MSQRTLGDQKAQSRIDEVERAREIGCTWCQKSATHITSKGVYVCADCRVNPILTKWKKRKESVQ